MKGGAGKKAGSAMLFLASLVGFSLPGPSGVALAKEPLHGLIDMQNIAWHNADGGQPTFVMANVQQFPGLFGGVVINATWSAIQPSATGPLDFSTIEDALTLVREYNAAHPTAPLGVKLRVYAGNSAPDWAKQISGGPVTLFRNPAGCHSASCPITGRAAAPHAVLGVSLRGTSGTGGRNVRAPGPSNVPRAWHRSGPTSTP